MAEKGIFQGERNEGEPEVGLDEWRPPGTRDHRGGGEKRAEGSVTWDQRDVEGMRDTIKTSGSKTEIAKLNSDTLQKKTTFSEGQKQQLSYPQQNRNFKTKSDSLKYDSAPINRKIP